MTKVKVRSYRRKKEDETATIDVMIRDERFGHRSVADLKRKRLRNPNEKRFLKKWEKERGGEKIGTV